MKFVLKFGFVFAALIIALTSWMLYQSTRDRVESSDWVSHTQEVLHAVGEINEVLGRTSAAQFLFMLSGKPAFLSERDQWLEKLAATMERVRTLTADNIVQQQRVATLEQLLTKRIDIMRQNVLLSRTEGLEAARARSTAGEARSTMEQIYQLTAELRQEEQRLLDVRRKTEKHLYQIELIVLVALVLTGGLILLFSYISLARQARARAQAERKLMVMANSLPGNMYQSRTNAQGNSTVTFLGGELMSIRGLKRDPLPTEEELLNTIDERDRPGFIAALTESRRLLVPFHFDYRSRRADGSEMWLHHEATLQREEDGSILTNGYIVDNTEQVMLKMALREAKEEADAASQAKSAFLAAMSHEIRTPMNGVLGMLELLSLTPLDTEQRATLEVVQESSKSLLRIIDDILDFSKIEAGKMEIRPEATSLRQVVKDVHNAYSGNASSKSLLIRHSTDPQISPALVVDPLRLRQILNNFVSNALKFTSHGSVEIRAELVERTNGQDRVRLSVKDTGIGISKEDQQRLFQPFAQGESVTARGVGGTGLGLTICRQLANMMGGSVEMVSQPGVGTTMILNLDLPIAEAEELPHSTINTAQEVLATKARRMAPSVAQAESEGTLVLLVDDHPTNRMLLMRQANALGYAAESAEDGGQAWDKWKSGRFSLVITDCNMPEMDGYELVQNIRRCESTNHRKRTPVIACTANALRGEAQKCINAGMDDYLTKPVALPELSEKLDRWLPIAQESADMLASSDSAINQSVLAKNSGGDKDLQRDILLNFRQANDEDVAALMKAVAMSDMPQLRRAAHRMVGASRMIGGLWFANVCERLEHASRSSNWELVDENMEAFRHEWIRLNQYIHAVQNQGIEGQLSTVNAQETSIAGLCFLVVEDHAFQCGELVRLLTGMGAKHIHQAADGRSALKMLETLPDPVDIVITDLKMPHMDGMEFVRHLQETGKPMSIILASALEPALLASVATMTEEYGSKLLGTVEKPITRGKLALMIARHMPTPVSPQHAAGPTFTLEEVMAGLKNDEFEPFFQPKISLKSGRVTGAEALARWRHPRHGIIAPYAFIKLLEDNALIDELTWVILKKAAAFCSAWRRAGADVTVSVNLSLRSLSNVRVAQRVIDIVLGQELNPCHLVLEITESALATDIAKALENLTRLRMHGFGLSIDDFGTGYSSIQQLTRIAFTELKIDQSFVIGAAKHHSARVILESSLTMARKLNIISVAEGVENRADFDLLCQLGCDVGQGYFIAKPMEGSTFMDWFHGKNQTEDCVILSR